MASVNKVIILGRLTKDPEVRFTQSGKAVCKLTIATSKQWVDKNSHERVQKSEFHRVTVWDKIAENAGKFLVKGSEVYVEGELQTSSYEKEGVKHYVTEIQSNDLRYVSTKATNEKLKENSGNQEQKPNTPNSGNSNNSRPSNNQNNGDWENPPGSNEVPEPDFNDFGGNPGDDDIPF